MTLALATLAINLWAFAVELRCVTTNARVIQAVMEDVERIRRERGLNTNDEALAEQVAETSRRG
jgi:hypothetical protein